MTGSAESTRAGKVSKRKRSSKKEPSSLASVEIGTEFERMGLLDPNELAGISVAVVAGSFPWWACVLGKAGVTLSSVICFTRCLS